MDRTQKINDAMTRYIQVLNELRGLGVLTNQKDFTCQLGEWIVAEIFDGHRSTNSIEKGWDVQTATKKIQVKAHAKATTTKAKFSTVNPITCKNCDEIIIIAFTPDYKIKMFIQAPWSVAEQYLTPDKKDPQKADIQWTPLIKENYLVNIETLPKQDFLRMFR